MYFKIKVNYTETNDKGKEKKVIQYYLTDAVNFADAGYKVVQEIGTEVEVEDVCLLKNYKPAVNEPFDENNKLFIVKIAEEVSQEDGSTKLYKYPMPVFANDNEQLQKIMRDYIKQGLEDMRLTTISETKWIYIK